MRFEITKMKVLDLGNMKAFVDVTFRGQDEDDNEISIEVKGFKIMDGVNGLFLSLPSQQDKVGKYWPTVWPNELLKQKLQDAILQKYAEETGAGPETPEEPGAVNMRGEKTPF